MKKLFKKIEIRKFNNLISKGGLPVSSGSELLYVIYNNKTYKPKYELGMEVR